MIILTGRWQCNNLNEESLSISLVLCACWGKYLCCAKEPDSLRDTSFIITGLHFLTTLASALQQPVTKFDDCQWLNSQLFSCGWNNTVLFYLLTENRGWCDVDWCRQKWQWRRCCLSRQMKRRRNVWRYRWVQPLCSVIFCLWPLSVSARYSTPSPCKPVHYY